LFQSFDNTVDSLCSCTHQLPQLARDLCHENLFIEFVCKQPVYCLVTSLEKMQKNFFPNFFVNGRRLEHFWDLAELEAKSPPWQFGDVISNVTIWMENFSDSPVVLYNVYLNSKFGWSSMASIRESMWFFVGKTPQR